MPLYEYNCDFCGPFTQIRPMEQRNEAAPCPVCDELAARAYTAPRLATMSPVRRMAAARNERSRHEPRMSTRSCCSSGSCSHKKKSDKPVLQASKKQSRPWMLGH